MAPNIQSVGVDLFSFQSNATGADRICSLLRGWLGYKASVLESTDFTVQHQARRGADFAEWNPSRARYALVAKARRYLSEHLDGKVGLSEIAVAIGVSPAYLTQTFRLVEGVSLYRYALRLRLMRALELLPQYDDLSELALDAGFSNHSHFTTTFRQSFGYAPATVRSRMRVRLGNDIPNRSAKA